MSLTSVPRRHPNGSSSPVIGEDETTSKITGAMRPTPTSAPNTSGPVRSTKAPPSHQSGKLKHSNKSTNGVKTSSVTSSPNKS